MSKIAKDTAGQKRNDDQERKVCMTLTWRNEKLGRCMGRKQNTVVDLEKLPLSWLRLAG